MSDELSDEEIETLWVKEAERRLDEMEQGLVIEIPAQEVLRRARALRLQIQGEGQGLLDPGHHVRRETP